MRCKKHPADLSSSVGVCASCLRERLFAIMAAQAQAQTQAQAQLEHRKSDNRQLPPLSFPRSVSPYISRRKSDTNAATLQLHAGQHHHHHRFYSTPLVGPTGSAELETISKSKKKSGSKGGRFSSLFMGLFRSKPNDPDPEPESGQVSDPGIPTESCSASPSWFSSIIPGRRKKQFCTSSAVEGAIRARRRACRDRDRGMSPARYSEDDEHCRGGSSGYSSEETTQSWGWTPRMTPASRRSGGRGASAGSNSRNASGLTFCLSPLVRPSPNRHWNQKGVTPEMAAGGESRVPPKAHLWAATSFCKNRSRKLADFGRYNYNTNH